jgi:hypothetical protein
MSYYLTFLATNEKGSHKMAPAAIPWLRKPQYLANDYNEPIQSSKPSTDLLEDEEGITYEDYLR